ncbi:MAG: hypothetical protein P9M14_16265 [Candidatus Alcyoniella australis]|nr:hypothetical protein [Candidatus Alcyoniella australis]
MRRNLILIVVLIASIVVAAVVVSAQDKVFEVKFTPRCTNGTKMIPDSAGWEFVPDRPMTISIPDIPLSADEKEQLYSGEPICKMLPGQGDKKIGWMRFFAPFDPVTAYWVITDSGRFSQQDESFPSTGSLFRKRHTFMPYCFDNAICPAEDMLWNLQYLVMPLVKPRMVCTSLCRNRDNFPWESAWWSSPNFYCMDKIEAELQDELKEAVRISRNRGAWHVSMLPQEFRRTAGDLNRAQILYIVDTEAGGSLGNLQSISNAATQKALPNLAANVTFIGERWEWFMKKYHPADDLQRFHAEQTEYRSIWGPQFNAK